MRNFALFLGIFLVVLVIVSSSLSLLTLVKVNELNNEITVFKDAVNDRVNSFTKNFQTDISEIKKLITPGGVLEEYVVAKTFIESLEEDLSTILTEAQQSDDRPYFRFFITGKEDVWIGLKNNKDDSSYFFQKTFFPGLSKEKFFYFKEPIVETDYTIIINNDSYIRTANPDAVYLIFFGFESGKLVQMPDSKVDNMSEKFNLYIPGQ
ncbi:MAG: hypothetical protein ACOC5R_06025 [Elusimicrobiota bacterium]